MVVLLAITTYIYTDISTKIGINPGIMPIASRGGAVGQHLFHQPAQ